MKRVIGLAFVAALSLTLGIMAFADQNMMSVTVREAPVRATPSFLGRILATLAYGDRVQVVSTRGDWVQIALPSGGGNGWLAASALTQKEIVLHSGGNVSQGASSGEVALAGKGFNEQVEQQYQSETHLDYSEVDQMEKDTIPVSTLIAFLKAGGLEGQGGAQ